MRNMSVLLVVVFPLICLDVGSATALSITLTEGTMLLNRVSDSLSPSSEEIVNPIMTPYSYTSSLTDGTNSSTSTYVLSNDGFSFTFDTFSEPPEYDFGDVGSTNSGKIAFSVDQNADFVADGVFDLVAPAGVHSNFLLKLHDHSVPIGFHEVFISHHFTFKEDGTGNTSYTLGQFGDELNNIDGQLSGTLIAGRPYELHYYAEQGIPFEAPGSVSATGNISFALTAIPEPGTALLVSLGLVGMAAKRRR